jgi:hypothetical protein
LQPLAGLTGQVRAVALLALVRNPVAAHPPFASPGVSLCAGHKRSRGECQKQHPAPFSELSMLSVSVHGHSTDSSSAIKVPNIQEIIRKLDRILPHVVFEQKNFVHAIPGRGGLAKGRPKP